MRTCFRCRSHAVNPHLYGRLPGVDLDLCDVCYWRKRAEGMALEVDDVWNRVHMIFSETKAKRDCQSAQRDTLHCRNCQQMKEDVWDRALVIFSEIKTKSDLVVRRDALRCCHCKQTKDVVAVTHSDNVLDVISSVGWEYELLDGRNFDKFVLFCSKECDNAAHTRSGKLRKAAAKEALSAATLKMILFH